jgi:hypothetical protein
MNPKFIGSGSKQHLNFMETTDMIHYQVLNQVSRNEGFYFFTVRA